MSSNLQKKLRGNYGLGAYFCSWSSNWSSTSLLLDLTNIDANINIVYLSFVTPQCTYEKESKSWVGTGLDFSSDFTIVKESIEKLKEKGVIVMLSVGGATFSFDVFNPINIVNLVLDLDCDGIDLDWEDIEGSAASFKLGNIIKMMKEKMPEQLLLSLAAFSTGAFGFNEFEKCLPVSQNTGMCINGINESGHLLDWINIMSYDAGINFDPLVAFKAYRQIFSGPLMIGVEVPPEAWGEHKTTLEEVEKYMNYILNDDELSNNGIFVWSYKKYGKPSCYDIIEECLKVLKLNPLKVITGWKSGLVYNSGSKVTYNGKIYLCNTSHPSNQYSAPNVNLWIEQNNTEKKQNLYKEWEENSNYNVDQIVLYKSKNYKCLASHTSITTWFPSEENKALWKLM